LAIRNTGLEEFTSLTSVLWNGEKSPVGNMMIEIITEAANIPDDVVEKMEGAFKNGEKIGRERERMSIEMNLKEMGYREEEIEKILNYKVAY